MADEVLLFDLEAGFEPGEVAGQVRIGKFEAQYEELFAEVIEDGVITLEERARLDKAADALGLDRVRLRRLEEALQAAYEARHHVRVREMADEEESPRSIVLGPEAALDPRLATLTLRVRELEAQVTQLTRELAQAREQVAVEVDLSSMAPPPPSADVADRETVDDLSRRIRSDPRDVIALRGLYRIHGRAGDLDRQWLVAQVLVALGAADDTERALYAKHRREGLIKPTGSVSPQGWRLLFHPDEELLTGQIFAVIAPAVLLARISTLRRDGTLPKLDPLHKQDPKVSTLQAVRCFSWAGSILGLGSPPLYAEPELDQAIEMVPGIPPSCRLGKRALAGHSPFELAFMVGRHLSFYREEHFIRLLVSSIADLEDLFLAALSVANAKLPLSSEVRRRVGPIARAIEPVLEPAAVDRLRGQYLRFIEEGGRTNLQRWAVAADRTAARAGLLLSNDLAAARAVLLAEDRAGAEAKVDDLIVFATGDRYAKLRSHIGVSLAATPRG